MILYLALLVVGGAAFGLLTYLASRWFVWGAWLLLLCEAKKVLTSSAFAPQVYLEDGVSAVLIAAGALRFVLLPLLSNRKPSRAALFCMVCLAGFLLLVFQSVLRGFLDPRVGGLYPIRPFLLYLTGLCYGLSWYAAAPEALVHTLGRAYLVVASWVVFVIVLRWVVNPQALLSADYVWDSGDWRVVHAAEALFLLEALVLGLAPQFLRDGRPRTWAVLAAAGGALCLLALGHRSVWVASLAVLFWWGWTSGKRGLVYGGLVLALAGIMIWVLTGPDPTTERDEFRRYLAEKLAEPFAAHSTIGWRYEGWESLLGIQVKGGLLYLCLGAPLGTGYYYASGMTHRFTYHNWYLQIEGDFGLIGLVLWAPLFLMGLWNLRQSDVCRRVLGVVCMASGFYYFAYPAPLTHGLLLGLSCAVYGSVHTRNSGEAEHAGVRPSYLPQPAH